MPNKLPLLKWPQQAASVVAFFVALAAGVYIFSLMFLTQHFILPVCLFILAVAVIVMIASRKSPFVRRHQAAVFLVPILVVLTSCVYLALHWDDILDWARYPDYASSPLSWIFNRIFSASDRNLPP